MPPYVGAGGIGTVPADGRCNCPRSAISPLSSSATLPPPRSLATTRPRPGVTSPPGFPHTFSRAARPQRQGARHPLREGVVRIGPRRIAGSPLLAKRVPSSERGGAYPSIRSSTPSISSAHSSQASSPRIPSLSIMQASWCTGGSASSAYSVKCSSSIRRYSSSLRCRSFC